MSVGLTLKSAVMMAVALVMAMGCSSGPSTAAPWRAPDGTMHTPRAANDRGLRACQKSDDACDCDRDDQCKSKPGGECHPGSTSGYGYDPGTVQRCFYPCRSDADCGGQICAPAGVASSVATCVVAGCRSSADCERADGERGACTGMRSFASQQLAYHCVYDSDACSTDRSCPAVQRDGRDREQACGFAAGVAECQPVPDPVP